MIDQHKGIIYCGETAYNILANIPCSSLEYNGKGLIIKQDLYLDPIKCITIDPDLVKILKDFESLVEGRKYGD